MTIYQSTNYEQVCVVQVTTETNKLLNFFVLKLAVHSKLSLEGSHADEPLAQLLHSVSQHTYISSVVQFLISRQM